MKEKERNSPVATLELAKTYRTFNSVSAVIDFLDAFHKMDKEERIASIPKLTFGKSFFFEASRNDYPCEFSNACGIDISDFASWRILQADVFTICFDKNRNNRRLYNFKIINGKL